MRINLGLLVSSGHRVTRRLCAIRAEGIAKHRISGYRIEAVDWSKLEALENEGILEHKEEGARERDKAPYQPPGRLKATNTHKHT